MIGMHEEEEVVESPEAMSDTESDITAQTLQEEEGLEAFIANYIPDAEEPRRWKKSPLEEYYTFKEWFSYCRDQKYVKLSEDKTWSALEGAKFIWNQSIPYSTEVAEAETAKKEFATLTELPLGSLRAGDKRSVVLQTIYAPDLRGPEDGGLALRTCHRGGADTWGGLEERAVLVMEVIDTKPSLQVVFRSFTGRTLYHDPTKNPAYPQISFHGWEDADYQEMKFELMPRAGDAHLEGDVKRSAYALAPTMAIKGVVIGTFAVLAAPAELERHQWTLSEDLAKEMRQKAVEAREEDGILSGRRRLKDDFARRYVDFETVVIYAAKKNMLADPEDAVDCARAVWKYMAVDEDEEERVRQAKRARRAEVEQDWNIV